MDGYHDIRLARNQGFSYLKALRWCFAGSASQQCGLESQGFVDNGIDILDGLHFVIRPLVVATRHRLIQMLLQLLLFLGAFCKEEESRGQAGRRRLAGESQHCPRDTFALSYLPAMIITRASSSKAAALGGAEASPSLTALSNQDTMS
jgi:hypothetical protein